MLIIFLSAILSLLVCLIIFSWYQWSELKKRLIQQDKQPALRELIVRLEERHDAQAKQHQALMTMLSQLSQHQLKGLTVLEEAMRSSLAVTEKRWLEGQRHQMSELERHFTTLNTSVDQRLSLISGQVEKRLSEGLEKTTTIFTQMVQRLTLIDQAQKKINELSTHVMDLKTVLADKRSRGAFGEVQLKALITNLMPASSFSWQHGLSNGKRVDCLLHLPKPTGDVAVDAKFPLENYKRMMSASPAEKKTAEQRFRQDIRKHIQDISVKYIILGETADGAVMFIPSESIFSEIHSHYPELVELAHQAKVWLVSPSTMMAVLTTALAVLKDTATQKQVHVIQEHLQRLGEDFERFQQRIGQLARHIEQAHSDVEQVQKSSRKITSRFQKIEKVELPDCLE